MKSVMVVDDEPNMLMVLEKMLKRGGYEVIAVDSGRGCLGRIKSDKPDLVLMDVLMPELDGWETSRRIKEDEETNHVPVVMYTIVGSREGKKKSYRFAHADFHLAKPADMVEVLRTVGKYVGKG